MLVVVAEVVLAELSSGVALLLEKVSNCRCPVGDPVCGTREADGQQARPERVLPQNEGRASCGAALLSIGVREQSSFFRQAVNVGGSVAHHAEVVGANIADTDVVAPNHKDVGFLRLR